MKKVMTPTSELWRLYLELDSVWKVADKVGLCGQSVHERLTKAGYKINNNTWTEEEKKELREYYKAATPDSFDIHALAKKMKRPYYGIAMKASRLGIADICRPPSEITKKKTSVFMRKWLQDNDHPRGMLGLKHNKKTLKKLSVASKKNYAKLSLKERSDKIMKSLKTKFKNGTLLLPRLNVSWKQSWQDIGGKRNFYRSSWEVNYAHYMEWLKQRKEIVEWEHEPTTFWFEKIRRGVRCYTPDFVITENSGNLVYHEIKGWMDARSKTKIKRMAKYHPEIELIVIDSPKYKKMAKQLKGLVPGWS